MAESTVLSLSYGRIVIKPIEKLHGLVPESFETYQVVDPGDLIVRSTDLQNDWNSKRIGLVRDRGIITSAYLCFSATPAFSPEYAYLLLHAYDLMKVFYGLGSGLRQNLDWTDFKRLTILLPPPDEQELIVRFLDWASVRLGKAIAAKRKVIGLLEEQKQAIIHRAVTRGLDDSVPLKPSGLEWLGDVPEHWEVAPLRSRMRIQRGRFLHRPRNDPRFFGGPFPFIQTGDIARATKHIRSHSQTLNAAGHQISRMFPKGTLAMVITGAKTGHVAILGFDACFPDSAVGFVPAKSVDTEYLYFLFHALKAELDRASITSTQENLNVGRIGRQVAPWPPLEEQVLVVDELNAELKFSDDAIDVRKREIALLQEYRTRLISDVVTGKLDVREFARTLPADVAEEAAELASSELGDEFSDTDDELDDELAGEPA
jgi:type I restriction enzyme S subunit